MAKKQRTILVTGAAGFVGHHMVEHLLKFTNDFIIGLDCLNYSGTWDRLRDIDIDCRDSDGCYGTVSAYEHPRFKPLVWDFRNKAEPNFIKELRKVTHVLHMGAESHVDGSIEDPMKFVMSNVVGCVNMLEMARELPNLELFLYFSTDEVFGPAPFGDFKGYSENHRHDPKNPYAATKSAAEQMVVAFANTYSIPCVITRQMNIIGERQHPEKFIPLCIKASLEGGHVQIHGTPDKKQAGLRHYIHARNVADAHLWLLDTHAGSFGGTKEVPSFHIVGELEMDNMTLAETIRDMVTESSQKPFKMPHFEMVDFHSSRPGHDLRYALNGSKMASLGWKPPKTFHESLRQTIKWTLNNKEWM